MDRVMIIDSDLQQIQEFNQGLSKEFHILNCSRGSKAMELFRIYKPSALILDPYTFELDGKDFIQRVRSLPSFRSMPIIALTRMTTLKKIEESFAWGVDAIYSKPCSADRITKKLREYLVKSVAVLELETSGV